MRGYSSYIAEGRVPLFPVGVMCQVLCASVRQESMWKILMSGTGVRHPRISRFERHVGYISPRERGFRGN